MDESVIFVAEIGSENDDVLFVAETKTKHPKRQFPIIDLSNESENIILEENNDKKKKKGLECPICLESLLNLEVKATKCGHMFCKNCIEITIKKSRPQCPICRKLINKNDLRPIFLN